MLIKSCRIDNQAQATVKRSSETIKKDMKLLLFVSTITALALNADGTASLERIDVKIIDPAKGTCTIKIHPGPPKTVNLDSKLHCF